MTDPLSLGVALIIFLGTMLAGFPIYAGILAAALYLNVFINHVTLEAVFAGLYESLTKPSLLAVPLFILTGSFMEASTMGERLINVFVRFLRRVRAGLPLACLFSNALFGAISGSAPAAAATFAKIAYQPLREEYGDDLATGLITSSGALSTIIPPSIIMIIYGVVTDTSISSLFLGGFVPGLILVSIVGTYLVFRCRKREMPVAAAEPKGKRLSWWGAVPVLLIPLIVLGGIYGGFFTPTEAGAVAAVYCALVAVLGYRDIGLRAVMGIFGEGARTTGKVFILIATSAVLAQAATLAQVPQMLTETFSGLSPWMFLLMLNVVLLIAGALMDPSSAILILTPLLLPTARRLGIDPMQVGIVLTVNLSIGMFTPPFGLNIFVVQSILKKPLEEIAVAVYPYVILYVIGLLLITYLPGVSLWLPRLMAS